MGRKHTLFYRIPLIILSAFGLLYLVVHTPLRQYLPGYLDPNARAQMEEYGMRIDSLQHASHIRSLYIDNLLAVLTDSLPSKTLVPFDSAVVKMQEDTVMQASQRVSDYVARYEEKERFNLGNAVSQQNNRPPLFISPVKGEVQRPRDNGKPFGINVLVTREMPVMAPLEGTVVSVTLVAGLGYEMVIQHANDYLTILSGLSLSLVDPKQQVKAGHVVGHVGGKSPSDNRIVNIQLWNKGNELDPLSVMSFN